MIGRAATRRLSAAGVLLLLTGLAAACVSDGESEAPAVQAAGAPQPAPSLRPRDCPPPDVSCSPEHNPAVCSAPSHAGTALPDSERPMGWGSNPCAARIALHRDACRRSLSPSALGGVACVPDTSGGACPPPPVLCAADYAPAVCAAHRYQGQELEENQVLRAEGSNACRATGALRLAACRQNLNPRGLQGIQCDSLSDPRPGAKR